MILYVHHYIIVTHYSIIFHIFITYDNIIIAMIQIPFYVVRIGAVTGIRNPCNPVSLVPVCPPQRHLFAQTASTRDTHTVLPRPVN